MEDAGLRTTLTTAAASGGFALRVGGSSVGKHEPSSKLSAPSRRSGGSFVDTPVLTAFAEQPTLRTVVWLDELQRYLGTRPSSSRSLAYESG